MSIGDSAPPPQGLPLLEAINLTLGAIQQRARSYRYLVVAVSAVPVSSIVVAIVCRSVAALSGMILLVPLAGGFMVVDTRRVRRWRKEILLMCQQTQLDLALFQETISAFRYLPPNSLHQMLATLAAEGKASYGGGQIATVHGPSRGAAFSNEEKRVLAGTVLLTLAAGSLASAAFFGSLWLLGGGVGLLASVLRLRKP